MGLATDGFTHFTRAGGAVPASLPPSRTTTVTYCTQQGTKLAMDLYAPPAGAARPAPAVLYVHGGGFVLGDRKPGGLGGGLANAIIGSLVIPFFLMPTIGSHGSRPWCFSDWASL